MVWADNELCNDLRGTVEDKRLDATLGDGPFTVREDCPLGVADALSKLLGPDEFSSQLVGSSRYICGGHGRRGVQI